jgi:hypothetical protein
MAVEPLNLSVARADAAQAIQALASAAERTGKASAARATQEAARLEPTAVGAPDGAEGNRVHDEDNGGALPYEGPPGKEQESPPEAPREAADPEGRGGLIDLTA